MELVRGKCVRCKVSGNEGVVSEAPVNDFVYVRWFISWNIPTNELHHYLEFVCQNDLDVIPSEKITAGLNMLRKYVLR